jgi:DNA topoisomerase-1
MAVDDFMTIKDVKRTYEKVEREKPSMDERIKIESPGRSTGADVLESGGEEKPKKKTVRKRTKKVEADSISHEGKYVFIVTEKPQAAQKIAAALGPVRKYTESGASYFEVQHGDKTIVVASAVGHLFNLEYKEGQKGWPIFELEWRPSYEKQKAAFTKKYYSLLKKLARKAGEVYVATDYDVEGEVIGWNVLRFICKRDTAKRMKYSTLTKDELIEAYEKPMAELDWGQAYAGEARHILDWLYGINLSRALMSAIKTTGSFKLLSIGRVQGPALKIIVDREKEIANFKPEPFWNVFAYVPKPEGSGIGAHPQTTLDSSENGKMNEETHLELKHPKDIFDKAELAKFENVTEGIAETKESEEKIRPPVPFDLTSLQRDAYRYHKIGPSQTLAIAQKLYLDGIISYPRTSSQKIPDSIKPREILRKLQVEFPEAKNAKRAKPVEGKKSDPAHPSIYPTGESGGGLKEQDKKIFELIARRFIAVFSDDAVTANRRVKVVSKENKEVYFTASGLKVLEKGWTNVYPASLEERDIPVLNGEVKIDKVDIVEKETQPPKRFSPTSLVTTLEKKNLGTKATRSSIVDTLFQRGYLDGKSIKATPLGMKLIDTLEKYSSIIIDENLTRQMEEEMEGFVLDKGRKKLEEMENEVVKKAEKVITDISKEFKAKEREIGKGIMTGVEKTREVEREQNTLRKCPTCGDGDLRILYSRRFKRQFVACSGYPKCTQTYSLPPNALIKKSGKDCMDCGFPKVVALRKGKRPWEFCFNVDCPENIKLREAWERRQAAKKEKEAEVGSGTGAELVLKRGGASVGSGVKKKAVKKRATRKKAVKKKRMKKSE